VHADVAGGAGQHRADQEADRGQPVQREADDQEQRTAGDGDGAVLAVEVGAGAFLDRPRDLLHALIASRLLQHPAGRDDTVQDCQHRATQCQPQTVLLQHFLLPKLSYDRRGASLTPPDGLVGAGAACRPDAPPNPAAAFLPWSDRQPLPGSGPPPSIATTRRPAAMAQYGFARTDTTRDDQTGSGCRGTAAHRDSRLDRAARRGRLVGGPAAHLELRRKPEGGAVGAADLAVFRLWLDGRGPVLRAVGLPARHPVRAGGTRRRDSAGSAALLAKAHWPRDPGLLGPTAA